MIEPRNNNNNNTLSLAFSTYATTLSLAFPTYARTLSLAIFNLREDFKPRTFDVREDIEPRIFNLREDIEPCISGIDHFQYRSFPIPPERNDAPIRTGQRSVHGEVYIRIYFSCVDLWSEACPG